MADDLKITKKRAFAVAPMVGRTDRHGRYFYRLLSKRAELYTEMITTSAILNGDKNRLLGFDFSEHPLILQLGGNDPAAMARCAKIAENYGYDGININVGCPSKRVRSGRFGACLMKTPRVVGACVAEVLEKTDLPVSVKTRIGIDGENSYPFLHDFVGAVASFGCRHFIFHARGVWLKGLNPKQNRTLPPLNYDFVYRLRDDFSSIFIGINGGIKTIFAAREHLKKIDQVMVGRQILRQPYLLANVDCEIYHDKNPPPSRAEILEKMMVYIEKNARAGVHPKFISRHLSGLYYGVAGSANFKQAIAAANHPSELKKWRMASNAATVK